MMSIKKKVSIILVVMAFSGLVLMGCGNSAASSEMGTFLKSLEQKINELSESFKTSDTNKIVALEKEIADLKDQWTTKRNDYGDELTPQEMERMVEEFNRIIARFNEIEKKKMG